MSDVLISRLANCRAIAAGRLPASGVEAIDLAIAEIQRLRTALAKIADWDSNWGPFPENNEAWRAMVVVTAREAVPELGPNARLKGACAGANEAS